ncbi:MAG: hypothetical protein WBP12_01260 [Candidatus Saccharimonas sp.]
MSKLVEVIITISDEYLEGISKVPRIGYITWDKGTLDNLIKRAYGAAVSALQQNHGCSEDIAKYSLTVEIGKIFDNELPEPSQAENMITAMRAIEDLRQQIESIHHEFVNLELGGSQDVLRFATLRNTKKNLQELLVQLSNDLLEKD